MEETGHIASAKV